MAKRPFPIAPRLGELRLTGLSAGDPGSLSAGGSYEAQHYHALDLSGADLTGASFSTCIFSDTTAGGADLRHGRFLEVAVQGLDAPTLGAAHTVLHDVVLEEARLGSAEFARTTWHSVHIHNSRFDRLDLRGAELRDVLFTNCTVVRLDLTDATAERVTFVDTFLDTLDVTGARLRNVDLRALHLRTVAGLRGLQGSTMTPAQVERLAPLLAADLGITIDG
jgi:uncharacterized protein YjbI with pentapeptide repeats